MDPLLARMIALGLGALFVGAAFGKLRDLPRFVATLAAYRLVPQRLAAPVGRTLAVFELGLGAGLLLGIATPAPVVASALLLLLYAGAMLINLARGRIDIDCGCSFGPAARISAGLVVRNVLLAAVALAAALPVSERTLAPADYGIATLAALTAVILLAAARQLLRNRSGMAADSARRR